MSPGKSLAEDVAQQALGCEQFLLYCDLKGANVYIHQNFKSLCPTPYNQYPGTTSIDKLLAESSPSVNITNKE